MESPPRVVNRSQGWSGLTDVIDHQYDILTVKFINDHINLINDGVLHNLQSELAEAVRRTQVSYASLKVPGEGDVKDTNSLLTMTRKQYAEFLITIKTVEHFKGREGLITFSARVTSAITVRAGMPKWQYEGCTGEVGVGVKRTKKSGNMSREIGHLEPPKLIRNVFNGEVPAELLARTLPKTHITFE